MSGIKGVILGGKYKREQIFPIDDKRKNKEIDSNFIIVMLLCLTIFLIGITAGYLIGKY
ncbi:MAG: hypothetical protein ACOC56_03865 [Atribacterota bacterium]